MALPTPRHVLVVAALAIAAAACGATDAAPTASGGTVPGVGQLPGPVSSDGLAPVPPTLRPTTTDVDGDGDTVGDVVDGNRVILIGDSILASTSRRYSNDTCLALVPNGWQVELNAESGQFVEFGDEVLDKRLSAGWDAAVVFLGNNYRGNQTQFVEQLAGIVRRLQPMPVVLVTVTEFRPDRRQVNDGIRFIAAEIPGVRVIDWAARTAGPDAERLLGGDGLHLSDAGREELAGEIALAMGAAPTGPGDCLKSDFTDDTRGPNVDGSSRPGGTATTTRPRPSTSTTVRPPSSSTSSVPTTGTTSPGSAPTTAPATATTAVAPTTAAPQPTSPPTTAAPQSTTGG